MQRGIKNLSVVSVLAKLLDICVSGLVGCYLKIIFSKSIPTMSLISSHFLDLVLALGRYSWDSSSRPFCLLYQSNRVLRMDGRQYSARELIELINCREAETGNSKRLTLRLYLNTSKHKNNWVDVSSVSHPPGQTASPLPSAGIYSVSFPVRCKKLA